MMVEERRVGRRDTPPSYGGGGGDVICPTNKAQASSFTSRTEQDWRTPIPTLTLLILTRRHHTKAGSQAHRPTGLPWWSLDLGITGPRREGQSKITKETDTHAVQDISGLSRCHGLLWLLVRDQDPRRGEGKLVKRETR
jgi:hypothetical protein